MIAPRQFEDNSASTPATQPSGQPGGQPGIASSPPHSPGIMADIIVTLLADRPDAAQILASVALRLAPAPPSVGQLTQHEQPGGQHGLQHSAFTTPSSVAVVKELSRSQLDAALAKDAVDLSSSSSITSSSTGAVSPVKHEVPPAKPLPPSPSLITTSTIPPNLLSSPSSIGVIQRVLEAPIDYTLKVWRSRALYEPTVVSEYARWSDPASPPHRDAPEALASLCDPDELGVPPALLSAHPDTAATAWHQYRGYLLTSLHRAFAAGVEWRRALRALSLLFSDPDCGHPRTASYVERALLDAQLVLVPPLHADVLVFQLDLSFAHGSRQHGLHSHGADWERATSRQPGEDLLTLAHRVVDAYVKKLGVALSDPSLVWQSVLYTNEINERFEACLRNDESLPARGLASAKEFVNELYLRRGQVERRMADRSTLSCISITEEHVAALEAARARFGDYSTT
ncbi:hypothetical protein OAO87_04515 [bacterium]|nr:hypothetical protein [bacterium]